ncbi:hypothetical protein L2748_17165 [Shewanella sairae]|nr:hypothetical protein [Shewanella sairae]MCL1131425.1 hypothetical protein [Shewanella sairae]
MIRADSNILPTQVPTSSKSPSSSGNSLLPISLRLIENMIHGNLLGQPYLVKPQQKLALQQIKLSQSFLLNIVHSQTNLIGLGQSLRLTLPPALLSVMTQGTEQAKKLQVLAKRKQGYRLPNVHIKNSELNFESGPSIKLAALASVSNGDYTASITSNHGQLNLTLTPIIFSEPVTLLSQSTAPQALDELVSNNDITPKETDSTNKLSDLAIAKSDISFIYKSLFKQLESTTLVKPLSSELLHSQSAIEVTANTVIPQSRKANKMLIGAIEKAGGLPAKKTAIVDPKQSLFGALLNAIPSVRPEQLTELSQPQQLKGSLAATSALWPSPNDWDAPVTNHIQTLGLLMQLLLARQTPHEISPALTERLSRLQLHLGLPEPLFALIESAIKIDSFEALLNNLALYQQASTKTPDSIHYYFALPYSINHYQEQLEGHIFKEKVEDKQAERYWNLQLKFNLSVGPLLIRAKMPLSGLPEPSSPLSLSLVTSNDALINKMQLLAPALRHKLKALGFGQVNIKTQCEAVAASILPGEHYLVKVKI